MDTIKLRTLTWKSKLWFGKFKDLTIQEIYDSTNTAYLRWLYYNNEQINFIDEILNKIFIYNEERIEKPGKNPEYGEAISKEIRSHSKYSIIIECKCKSHFKARATTRRAVDKRTYSRRVLQAKNQGIY